MKNIHILAIYILTSLACKAQHPIIDIEKKPSIWDEQTENVYYKDINNFFDGFTGVWKAERSNKILIIDLKKIVKIPNDIPYYADYMVGEYKYLENGIEKINTLNNTDIFKRGISGGYLVKHDQKPPCSNCKPEKRRLLLTFSDRVRNIHGSIILQVVTINGKQALKGLIYNVGGMSYHEDNKPQYFDITAATGLWTFIKQ